MGRNFERGLEAVRPAIGHAPYWFWPPGMDVVPDGAGAFAVNRALPEDLVWQMNTKGIFCQGLINVMRRANRKIVPTLGFSQYDGGTWANQGFFRPFVRPFSRYVRIPRGALVGRYFRWAGAPGFSAVLDQGHVGVLLEEQNLKEQKPGLLLHSHPAVGGLARTNLGHSHAGWYYDYWVHPEDWIDHDKGGF